MAWDSLVDFRTVEVIWTATSAANNCEICLSFHAGALLGAEKPADEVATMAAGGVPKDPKMARLVIGGGDPVVPEPDGQILARKTHGDVPVQVDGVEFDMRDGVEEGDAPRGPAAPPFRHVARIQQFGPVRPRGAERGISAPDLHRRAALTRGAPGRSGLSRLRHLFPPAGRAQHRLAQRGEAGHSASAAASTSSTWPLTFTLRQIRAILPSASIRYVARSIPMEVLPYIFFSTQTP